MQLENWLHFISWPSLGLLHRSCLEPLGDLQSVQPQMVTVLIWILLRSNQAYALFDSAIVDWRDAVHRVQQIFVRGRLHVDSAF